MTEKDLEIQELRRRIKAYEATGLEPEEIEEINELGGVAYLRELVQAEKGGRLVVPPCKVGDTLWTKISIQGDRYRKTDRPHPVKVFFIGIAEKGGYLLAESTNGRAFTFGFDRIGKTAFLTHEDAEAALKGGDER